MAFLGLHISVTDGCIDLCFVVSQELVKLDGIALQHLLAPLESIFSATLSRSCERWPPEQTCAVALVATEMCRLEAFSPACIRKCHRCITMDTNDAIHCMQMNRWATVGTGYRSCDAHSEVTQENVVLEAATVNIRLSKHGANRQQVKGGALHIKMLLESSSWSILAIKYPGGW